MWAKERILVMEFISGHRPDDLQFLDSNGIDRDEVSAAFAHIFNEMIFGDNAPLHCDPHGGNIAIRKSDTRGKPNFDIILYDHGLYRDIPQDLRRNYAKLWLSVIEGDEPRMRQYAREVAGVSDELFPIFASAITGRDYTVVTQKNIVSPRNSIEEKSHVTNALGDGMLQQLVDLLGRVPRIILLILKTNDLSEFFLFLFLFFNKSKSIKLIYLFPQPEALTRTYTPVKGLYAHSSSSRATRLVLCSKSKWKSSL